MQLKQTVKVKLTVKTRLIYAAAGVAVTAIIIGIIVFLYSNLGTSEKARASVSGDYRSAGTGLWSNSGIWEKYNGTTWASAATSPVNTNGAVTIQSGHVVTVSANLTIDQVTISAGAEVDINSGITISLTNGAGTDLDVFGTFKNLGTVSTAGGVTATVENGGKYQHATDGGSILSATWNTGSTCEITGVIATKPSSLGQSFYNFTWNAASQSGVVNLLGQLTTVTGDFRISSTGSSQLNLSTSAANLTIGGNYYQTGGTFSTVNAVNKMDSLLLSGNYSQTGGTIMNTGNTNSRTWIVFKGYGTRTFVKSGSAVMNNTGSSKICAEVRSGCTLDLGTYIMDCYDFILSSGGGLNSSSPDGITNSGNTGNIQAAGTRTFSTGGSYTYNGTSAQTTGTGLPASVNSLTINNSSGVTLTATVEVTSFLSLVSGLLTTGSSHEVYVSNPASDAIINYSLTSYVNGYLRRALTACSPINHNNYTNFNSTTSAATSLWLNVHTKLTSDDLPNNGDSVVVYGGTITFTGITSSPTVTYQSVPKGKLVADNTITDPATTYSSTNNTWTTRVPPGYVSADIFITGVIINSSNGFTAGAGKASSLSVYCKTNLPSFNSSWFCGLACYQPQFAYSSISGTNQVYPVANGMKAGTPTTQTAFVVSGGSGGGGANYTGGYSSTDPLTTTCTASGPFDFPVGTSSQYELATITTSNLTITQNILVNFNNPNTGTTPNPNTCQINGTGIFNLLNYGFWNVIPDALGSGTYDLTVKERGYTNGGGNSNNYALITRSTTVSNWISSGTHTNATQSEINGTFTAARTGLTVSGNFAIGSSPYIMPIQVTYFKAEPENNSKVHLTWETATEHNINFFIIKRSTDGNTWENIDTIASLGDSYITQHYATLDIHPIKGTSYYRLEQREFDFTSYYTNVVMVQIAEELNAVFNDFNAYPNPTRGVLNVSMKEITDQTMIRVFDIKGALIKEIKPAKGGNTQIDLSGKSPGTYLVKVGTGDANDVSKQIVLSQ